MKILVIEDNRDIAANIADYLEPRGHVLDFAATGPHGLQLALQEPHDAIVLDVNLPGLDGMTLCRRLRGEGRSAVPVLMLTARDQLEDKLEGFAAGVDDYLVKPFSVKELEVRLQALQRRGQKYAELSREESSDALVELADLRCVTQCGSSASLARELAILEHCDARHAYRH